MDIRNRRASSLVAVIMPGLGIGATAAVFSVVNAVLLRPLPFPESDRLVWIWSFDSRRALQQWVSYPDLLDWRRQAGSFAQLAGTGTGSELVLTGNGEPQRFELLIVTTNLISHARRSAAARDDGSR